MTETPLTQEVIDGGSADDGEKGSIFSKAVHHPFLTGGALLVGAGLAYAAAKIIITADESKEVAREFLIETSIAIDKAPAELYSFWRNFKNLPLFMRNLKSVTEFGKLTFDTVGI